MLRLGKLHAAPALAALALLAAACSPGVVKETFIKVETNRSEPQHLVVTNDTGKTLTLLAVELGEAPRRLLPSENTVLTFSVAAISVAEISPGQPWYTPKKAGRSLVIVSSGPVQYVTMSGPDAVLRVKPEDDTAWTFRLVLQSCDKPDWAGSPVPSADRAFPITGPPREGIPDDVLCSRE